MNRVKTWICAALCLLLTVAATGCGSAPAPESSSDPAEQTPEQRIEGNKAISDSDVQLIQFDTPKSGDPVAVIDTNLGTIKVVFYPDEAPKAVENFLALAQSGYYNGLNFHRIVNQYLIQSGDPTGTGTGGESSFKDSETGSPVGFENEYSLNLWNFRGALGMANNADGLNGSQFYIIQSGRVDDDIVAQMKEAAFPEKVVEQYQKVGGAPWLDSKLTVFGQVIEGLDVVDAIASSAAAPAESQSSGASSPAVVPLITNITVTTYTA